MSNRASNPWDLTRSHPDEYRDWMQQARDGETLQGFAEWLAAGSEEAEQ